MLKQRDVDDDTDDDDKVRITVPSQNRATATLSTKEFFLRTRYLQLSPHIIRGVGEMTGNRRSIQYIKTVPAGFSAPSQTSLLQNRIYKSIQLFCV
jgi:hypothetical protein